MKGATQDTKPSSSRQARSGHHPPTWGHSSSCPPASCGSPLSTTCAAPTTSSVSTLPSPPQGPLRPFSTPSNPVVRILPAYACTPSLLLWRPQPPRPPTLRAPLVNIFLRVLRVLFPCTICWRNFDIAFHASEGVLVRNLDVDPSRVVR